MTLRMKLMIFSLLVCLAPTATVGLFSVQMASSALDAASRQQLTSVRDARLHELEALLARFTHEAAIYAGVKEIYNALGMLRDHAWGTARAGVRMDVADPAFVDLLGYVGGGPSRPSWRCSVSRTRCSWATTGGCTTATSGAANWAKT